MPDKIVYSTYRRAVLNHHVGEIMTKLLTVRVAFEYKPGFTAGWSHISVAPKHAPTLDRCIDQFRLAHALADLDAEFI